MSARTVLLFSVQRDRDKSLEQAAVQQGMHTFQKQSKHFMNDWVTTTQVCAANGSPLSMDAQLHRLPQLPLLCVVHSLLVARVCILGKPFTNLCLHTLLHH